MLAWRRCRPWRTTPLHFQPGRLLANFRERSPPKKEAGARARFFFSNSNPLLISLCFWRICLIYLREVVARRGSFQPTLKKEKIMFRRILFVTVLVGLLVGPLPAAADPPGPPVPYSSEWLALY